MIEKCPGESGSIEIFLGGKLILSKKNRIVSSSRTIKASMAMGGPSSDYISHIQIGYTGSINPAAVQDNETALFNVIKTIPVGYNQEPRPFINDDPLLRAFSSVVTWTAVVPVEDSLIFDEAGLFSNLVYMFSRVTFPVINKPEGTAMALRWTIQF